MENNEERRLDEVEKYFGITYDELDDESYELKLMCRIQCDYENGTIGKDISYYASFYGY